MIASKNIKPEYSLYFLGGEIIKSFKDFEEPEIDVFFIYENVKKRVNYSFTQHLMALNWLYILGALILTDDGRLKLCS